MKIHRSEYDSYHKDTIDIIQLYTFEAFNSQIQVGDLILYTGDYCRDRKLFWSGITKCTKIHVDDLNITRIYFVNNEGEEDWLSDKFFKKIAYQQITNNNLSSGDLILSLENISEKSRQKYEVLQVKNIRKRPDGFNESIVYINKMKQDRVSSCDRMGINTGFVKIFPIFNETYKKTFIFENKDNSYLNLVKNLIN